MKSILVADDDRMTRHLLRDVLKTAGYSVGAVANGATALGSSIFRLASSIRKLTALSAVTSRGGTLMPCRLLASGVLQKRWWAKDRGHGWIRVSCGLQVHSDDVISLHTSAPMQRRTTALGSRGHGCMSPQYWTIVVLGGLDDDAEFSRLVPSC